MQQIYNWNWSMTDSLEETIKTFIEQANLRITSVVPLRYTETEVLGKYVITKAIILMEPIKKEE